jgi:hypothetical protein
VRSTPARALHNGQLIVDRYAVNKITAEPFRLPHNTASVELVNQMTGEQSTRNLRWDELSRISVYVTRRDTQGVLHGPTQGLRPEVSQPAAYNHARVRGPVIHRLGFTPGGVNARRPPVASLLGVGRPSTVLRRVRAVVVDSVKGQAIAVAISQCPFSKWLKVFPVRDVRDASASVPLPSDRFWVIAACFHPRPDCVKPRAPHAMSSIPGRTSFAAAAFACSQPKVVESPVCDRSAITTNWDKAKSAFQKRWADNSPVAVSVADFRKRMNTRHRHARITIVRPTTANNTIGIR